VSVARTAGALRALAPGKINLGLFVGPPRDGDGRHELVTVMQSISLADELTLAPAPPGSSADVVDCAGVPGPAADNLAAAALDAFREQTGWDGPPQLLRIDKRIPVAAGLAGGSADAAAALRLAARASGLGTPAQLSAIAARLGADVPAQLQPGRWLATGAGERLRPLPPPRAGLGVLVLPLSAELATGAVYTEADRLGLTRAAGELAAREGELAAALEHGAGLPHASELLHNDLQRAAVSLCPAIVPALREARAAGADVALVSGSGPTVLGLFAAAPELLRDAGERARAAAEALAASYPHAVAATAVSADFAQACALADDG
jgi:4-diphosphocytidyl-2-C-methyl-D-erythritol kinase